MLLKTAPIKMFGNSKINSLNLLNKYITTQISQEQYKSFSDKLNSITCHFNKQQITMTTFNANFIRENQLYQFLQIPNMQGTFNIFLCLIFS
jgi:hypothetical protein